MLYFTTTFVDFSSHSFSDIFLGMEKKKNWKKYRVLQKQIIKLFFKIYFISYDKFMILTIFLS